MTSKHVFITGCSSGIGLASAKMLQQHGWHVMAGYRKAADESKLIALGLTPVRCDLDSPTSIEEAADRVLALSNHQLDALVNNAAFGQPGAFEDLSTDALRRQFETNVFGQHQLTRALLPAMREQGHGRIVMISSILGIVDVPFLGAYNASKHALEALSSALRMELHGTGIHVSVVQPGPIKSEFRNNALLAYNEAPLRSQWHQRVYSRWCERQAKCQVSTSLGPEAVARRVWHAIKSPRPRLYYKVTTYSHVAALLFRWLPSRAWDRLVRMHQLQ